MNLHIADGSEFVRNSEDGFYDVVIQDSSDPFTWADDGSKIELPSNVLYDEGHFKEIHRILSPDGVFNFQAEVRFPLNKFVSLFKLFFHNPQVFFIEMC